MALNLQLRKIGVDSTYTKLQVIDNTGVYNVDSNPGGYGSPNLDRVDVSLWLEDAINKRNDGDVVVAIDSYSAETVTDWFVARNLDGWYQMNAYTIQDFDSVGNSYVDNDQFATNELVYDPSTTTFYEITGVTGAGPYSYTFTTLAAATVADAITAGSASISPNASLAFNTYDLSNLNIIHAKLLKKYYVTKDDDDFETYTTLDAVLKLIRIEFENGNYTTAQDLVENFESLEDCVEGIVCTIAGA